MKRIPDEFKAVNYAFKTGVLDGRSPCGEAGPNDYRVLLNVATSEERGRKRLGGWLARTTDANSPGNEDLHDQLLGAVGQGTLVQYGCPAALVTGGTTAGLVTTWTPITHDGTTVGGPTWAPPET